MSEIGPDIGTEAPGLEPPDRPGILLTEGSISRVLWAFGLPMIAAMGLNSLLGLTDLFFVGRLGSVAIAAVALGSLVMGMVFSIELGVGVGTVAIISRLLGAREVGPLREAVHQSLLLAFLLSVVLAVAGSLSAARLLTALGASPTVVTVGASYLVVLTAAIPLLYVQSQTSAVLRGLGEAKRSVAVLMISTLINLVLDPFLIFGWGPFPRLEVVGAALATVVGRVVGSLLGLWYLGHGEGAVGLSLRELGPRWTTMWRVIRVGIPGTVQIVVRHLGSLILARVVTLFGTAAVAAYGIGLRLELMVLLPIYGLSRGLATIVGQNLGAGKPERAVASTWAALGYSLLIMGLESVALVLFAPEIIGVFDKSEPVVGAGSEYLRVLGPAYLLATIAAVSSNTLNGAGETDTPMAVAGISLLGVQIPAAYLLAVPVGWGTVGIWLGMGVAHLVAAGILMVAFLRGRWKSKTI